VRFAIIVFALLLANACNLVLGLEPGCALCAAAHNGCRDNKGCLPASLVCTAERALYDNVVSCICDPNTCAAKCPALCSGSVDSSFECSSCVLSTGCQCP
jgi:hypothetical protein